MMFMFVVVAAAAQQLSISGSAARLLSKQRSDVTNVPPVASFDWTRSFVMGQEQDDASQTDISPVGLCELALNRCDLYLVSHN